MTTNARLVKLVPKIFVLHVLPIEWHLQTVLVMKAITNLDNNVLPVTTSAFTVHLNLNVPAAPETESIHQHVSVHKTPMIMESMFVLLAKINVKRARLMVPVSPALTTELTFQNVNVNLIILK